MTNDNDQIAPELAAARTAHMAGDLAAALPVYERFAGENDPDALNLLGIVAGQQGDMTLAETRFRAALTARPNHRGAGINLAKLLGSQARSAEAVAVWARLAADHATEHPLDRAMWLEYARHLGYCHRHDDAHGILARLHEEEPGDPVVAEALLMASRYIADWSRHDRLTALVAAETAKRLAQGQTGDQTGEQVPLETPMMAEPSAGLPRPMPPVLPQRQKNYPPDPCGRMAGRSASACSRRIFTILRRPCSCCVGC